MRGALVTAAITAIVTAALAAGCGEKKKGPSDDAPKSSAAAGSAGQAATAVKDAGPTGPTVVGPGMASSHGTAGETECFDRETCEARCEGKAPGACDRLAELLEKGWGGDADRARAAELRAAACAAGDPAACFHRLREDDFPVAALESACEAGHGRACYVLARQSGVRAMDEREYELAEASYDNDACAAGYAYSCEIIAQATSDAYRRYKKDPEALAARAKTLRERDCAAGVAFACASLAVLGDRDKYARAGLLYKRQCEAGYPPGCFEYLKLAGAKHIDATPADVTAARDRACELGATDVAGKPCEP